MRLTGDRIMSARPRRIEDRALINIMIEQRGVWMRMFEASCPKLT
jgi:hypothetical protein